jgi:hypothetical protein
MIHAESGIRAMIQDPDEGLFVQALLNASQRDASLLLRYARYLEERDRDRGEFLRLEALLSGKDHCGCLSPELQSRHLDLLHSLAGFDLWLRLVRHNHRILNCGHAPQIAFAVRFRFQCPTSWEALAATPHEGVRYCAECRRDVYYCDDVRSAERHALAGDCITIPVHLMGTLRDEVETTGVLGQPDIIEMWGEKIFSTDRPTKGTAKTNGRHRDPMWDRDLDG